MANLDKTLSAKKGRYKRHMFRTRSIPSAPLPFQATPQQHKLQQFGQTAEVRWTTRCWPADDAVHWKMQLFLLATLSSVPKDEVPWITQGFRAMFLIRISIRTH